MASKLTIGTLLLVLAVVATTPYIDRLVSSSPTGQWSPTVGQTAPTLQVVDHRGEPFDLANLTEKVVLLEYVGMQCPACQSLSDAESFGTFGGVSAQPMLQSVKQLLERFGAGTDIQDDRLVFAQLILYDLDTGSPSFETVQDWASHFQFDQRPNHYVLKGTPQLQSKIPTSMVPGFLLIDKQGLVRCLSDKSDPLVLYEELLPMVPRLLAEGPEENENTQLVNVNKARDRELLSAAQTNLQKGKKHARRHEYGEALGFLKTAVRISEQENDQESLVKALMELGEVQQKIGQTSPAIETFKRALKLQIKGKDRLGMGHCLQHLGILHLYSGDLDGSKRFLDLGLRICTKGNDAIGAARCQNGMGCLMMRLGNYRDALAFLHQSLDEFEQLDDREGQGIVSNDLASTYQLLRSYETAMRYQRKAAKIAEELKDPVGTLMTSLNLTSMSAAHRQPRQAMVEVNKCLSLAQKMGHTTAKASSIMLAAELFYQLKRYEQAARFIQRSIRLHRETGNDGMVAQGQAYLASCQSKLGRKKQARSTLDDAIDSSRRLQLHNILADCLDISSQMRLKSELKERNQGLDELAEAIALRERMSTGLNTVTKSRFFDDDGSCYERMITNLVSVGRHTDAFSYSERARSQAFVESMGNQQRPLHKLDPEMAEKEQHLLSQLRSLALMPGGAAPSSQVAQLRSEYEDLLEEMWVQSPEAARLRQVRGPDVEEIQSCLQDGRVLVEFFFGREESWAWVISNQSADVVTLDTNRDRLRNRVVQVRNELATADSLNTETGAIAKLSSELIQPIKHLIRGNSQITVVPHQALHYIPFHVLLTSGKGASQPLFQNFAVDSTPSATALQLSKTRGSRNQGRISLAAIGNAKLEWISEERNRLAIGSSSSLFAKQSHTALPGSLHEVNEIAKIFPTRSFVLLGDAMTTDALRNAATDASIVHIASHGFLDPTNPWVSGVMTADGNDYGRRSFPLGFV